MSEAILDLPAPAADARLPYGDDPFQFGDLRLPRGAGPHPVAMVIHGGFWRARYDLEHIGHVCAALTRVGNRHTAYETLRRDKHARALLDLPARSWAVLLRALLGTPQAELAATAAGRGVLLRLLIGETLPLLLRDDDLVLTLSLAAPGTKAGRGAR